MGRRKDTHPLDVTRLKAASANFAPNPRPELLAIQIQIQDSGPWEFFELLGWRAELTVEQAVLNSAYLHHDGYWWEDGFDRLFDNLSVVDNASLEDLSTAFGKRFDVYFSDVPKLDMLQNVDSVKKVIYDWNCRIFVALAGEYTLVFCYSNSE